MRIVDSYTGRTLKNGDSFRCPSGAFETLLAVDDRGLFSARALLRDAHGDRWVPLQVRVLHPKYLFQRVGFIPS